MLFWLERARKGRGKERKKPEVKDGMIGKMSKMPLFLFFSSVVFYSSMVRVTGYVFHVKE